MEIIYRNYTRNYICRHTDMSLLLGYTDQAEGTCNAFGHPPSQPPRGPGPCKKFVFAYVHPLVYSVCSWKYNTYVISIYNLHI